MSESRDSVRYVKGGKGVLEVGGIVWDAKYSLSIFALTESSVTKFPFSMSEGMPHDCLLPKTDLVSFQKFLEVVSGSRILEVRAE